MFGYPMITDELGYIVLRIITINKVEQSSTGRPAPALPQKSNCERFAFIFRKG
jgi:hypothetical protein